MKVQNDYGKYDFTRKESIIFIVCYLAVSVSAAMLFYRNILFAVILIPFITKVKEQITGMIVERRKRKLLQEFKDMLFMISTSIGAGRSIKDAIYEAVPGISGIYGSSSYLVPEMLDMYTRMEEGNEKDTDVLFDFAVRTGMEDIIDFVTVYSTCRETGASLILALNKASSVIIDKMSIDNEIRELVRRKESEGAVIFAMPVIVLLFLNITAPDYVAPLYTTLAGRIIMTVTVLSNFIIYRIIRNITKVEV